MLRRSFAGLAVAGVVVAVVGVVAVPALITGLSPALIRQRKENWRRVGRLVDFPIGVVSEGSISRRNGSWPKLLRHQAAFIWRPSETNFIVFSKSCTDLGCQLDYDAGSACFFCPCHGGIFTQDGERLAGPPDRPLYRYAHRVRDGELEVDTTPIPPGN